MKWKDKFLITTEDIKILKISLKVAQLLQTYNEETVPKTGGRYSSVGIATRYRLDGPGMEPRWGRDFPYPSRPTLGPTQPPGDKEAGAWC